MRFAELLHRALAACILLLACLPAQAARDVAATRECSICHIAWVPDFKRQDVTALTPFEPRPVTATGRQDVVSTDRMCWSCHDGFVMDSRLAWAGRGHGHPVGMVPSKHVQLPVRRDGKNQFPLNDEGKVYCGTCHSAHGVDWEGKSRSKIFLRMPNIDSSICVACHLERSTGPKEGNHPIYKFMKDKPAALIAAGSRFNEKGELICESCHRIHGAADRKILIMANDASQLCGACHTDRYAKDRAEAGAMGTHPVNVKPDKAVISPELIKAGGKQGPNGTIICQTCHKPHFAEHNANILVQRNPQSQLCQSCHEAQKSVLESRHNFAKLDRTVTNLKDQTVEQAGVCSGCHLPHGGAGPKMVAQRQVGEPPAEKISGLCLSCHRDGGVASEKTIGEHSHPVGRDLARLPGKTDLPGFSKDGIKTAGKGMLGCATCHDPHQAEVRDGAKSPPNFLRQANDARSTLCRGCHSDKEEIVNTKHDLNAMAPESRNVNDETPAQAGVCGNCHLPHQGKGPRMWAREPKAGADPVSSTCLSCHDKDGVAKDKLVGGISHPTGVTMERTGVVIRDHKWQAADGSGRALVALPLYDANGVPVADGGTVTCGACHDPHRWSAIKGLDAGKHPKDVIGTPQSRFLRLPLDGESTLCGNCHNNKAPVAYSKHNLAISAADATNADGKTVAQSGTCGACHQPHNAHGAKLWARGDGPGGDEIERKCTACHKQDGVAGEKLTGVASHPVGVDLERAGGETSLPLFAADGKRDAKGKMSCATCHDAHQWEPRDAASRRGADAKAEGHGSDSFLRLPASPRPELCGDCHRDKRWVNGTVHDLRVSAPDTTNVNGETPEQSGACGQCHTPHNAVAKAKLWARQPGAGEEPMERLCRSCHAKGQIAEAKQPVKARHPKEVTVIATTRYARAGARSDFPVFDAEGKRSDMGKITCPTCHNPHQWKAGEQKEGPGKMVEGDAVSSFLRNPSEHAMCADCHGLDSLFRYKYFHGEQSRKKHRLAR